MVKGGSVSVGSTGMGRGMVSILLGGAGLGTTSKDCRTFARWYFVAVDIVGAVKTSQILPG